MKTQSNTSRVAIIGAGAAGLFCASQAAKLGCQVTVFDSGKKAGRKILMSGGGRCNFTNLYTSPQNYLSNNPHFCKSALARYTPWDFLALVNQHQIAYEEREHGQLFCELSASQIVDMLLEQCQLSAVNVQLRANVEQIQARAGNSAQYGFEVQVNGELRHFDAVVLATGGLSLPQLGVSPLGYRVAEQFGLQVTAARAGLVPLTLHKETLAILQSLAGVAVEVAVSSPSSPIFREAMLFTHRGISGPAILQVSNYWTPGEALSIDLTVSTDLPQLFAMERATHPKQSIKNTLAKALPKRLIEALQELAVIHDVELPLSQLSSTQQQALFLALSHWQLVPNGTEGYRTAEVTLGGVSSTELSSKTMEALRVPNLYFIGEVIDVTGWLGGFNFQWAWSSGWACAQALGSQI